MMIRVLGIACVLVACGDDGNVNPLPDAPLPNNPPQVTINAKDQVSLVGRVITLRAVATDLDNDILTFEWTQDAGPAVELLNPTSAAPAYIARSVGVYRFTVVASDGLRKSPPVEIKVSVYDLDGGEEHTLALKPDGTLFAWGSNGEGEIGDPNVFPERRFVAPVCEPDQKECIPFGGAIAIATGRAHSLALRSDGTVWAWGDHSRGQLGVGNQKISASFQPLQVCNVGASDCTKDPLTDVIHIAAGFTFSAALRRDGTVVAWGSNNFGELGDGSFDDKSTPVRVCAPGQTGLSFGVGPVPCTEFLDGVTQLTAGGGGHSIAIRGSDNAVFAWGHNKAGQVGIGDFTQREITIPRPVCAVGETAPCATFLVDVIAADAWSGHSLALRADGSMIAWGSNDDAELGALTTDLCSSGNCSQVPVPVCLTNDDPCTTPFTNVAMFAAGRRFSVALTNDGKVFSWGSNADGQLGDGSDLSTLRVSPAQVCAFGASPPCTELLEGFGLVAAGSFHALALRDDGLLFTWGDNEFGQLGNNDAVDASVPVVVGGF